MADYELRLTSDRGADPQTLTPDAFSWAIVRHDVGACQVVLTPEWSDWLKYDRRIDIWRAEGVRAAALMRSYIIRRIDDETNEKGERRLTVTGYDGNYLLAGGIVEYAAGSAQASMTDQADDMAKEVVRDSIGADSPEPLDAGYFSVAANLGLGPSITKGFAWRNLLAVLRDIADEADGAGTPIYWHVFDTASGGFEFRTMTGQLGIDHSSTSAVPLIFGLDRGNLRSARLTLDASEEVNHAFVGGQGEGSARLIGESTSSRAGADLWSRRKGFADATDLSVQASVDNAAARAVVKRKPVQRFEAQINPTQGSRLWYDWWFGDKLTAEYRGLYYTAHVNALKVDVGSDHQESVEAKLEVTV